MINTQRKLENFFFDLSLKINFVDEINSLFGKTLAVDFNSFDFWSIDENKISEIIAFFLNPAQKHQQDDLYLKLFIDFFQLDFNYSNVNEIEVSKEKVIDANRRLDIFISYKKTKKLIGIENKIYDHTKDQNNQIIDYINYLKRINKDDFVLFYLAPRAKIISDKSISEEEKKYYLDSKKLIIINYEEDIIDLIHLFAIHSENERVRAFLLDFERKIRKTYIGMENINDGAIVSQYIEQTQEHIGLAFKIANSLSNLKKNLTDVLIQQMQEVAEELKIEFIESGRHFVLPNLKNHFVKINFEMGGLIYGIVKTPERFNNSSKYGLENIEKIYPNKFKCSQWWPLYDFMYRNVDVNAELWIDVKNGVFKEKIRDFIYPLLTLNDLESQL